MPYPRILKSLHPAQIPPNARALIAFLLAGIFPHVHATPLTDSSGNSYHGELAEVFNNVAILIDDAGNKSQVHIESLSPDSRQIVDAWMADNPYAINVYTEFDEPPSPSRTNNPRNFLDRTVRNETGMVAVELILDESGDVVLSKIVRSSNDLLNDASLQAVSEWKFSPAKVGGKTVKARLRVPLRY